MEEEEDDTGSIDEAEEEEIEDPMIECLSEQEDMLADVLNADAEIEDLGKRRGTNDARDEMVKKLKMIPPNAHTSQGGFREVPIQGNTGKSSNTFKTYKVRKDPYSKDIKETMSKPVAVPMD